MTTKIERKDLHGLNPAAWAAAGRKSQRDKVEGTALWPGKRCLHPNGYPVQVISGSYCGDNGLVSNFFYWKRIKKDGSLSAKTECGYGWFGLELP